MRIENALTRLLGRIGGGYRYAACYLVGDELLVDTGYPWAGRALRDTLRDLGVAGTLTHVVNTHAHEDHVGNNDVVAALADVEVLVHPSAVAAVRWPAEVPWYRGFMFGPLTGSRVGPLGDRLEVGGCRFDVVPTPGHTADHVCLFEPDRGWLFAGDLYVDERLDAQLDDVDGPSWVASLDRALALDATVLFDGHGLVVRGRSAVREALAGKRAFLDGVRRRTWEEAPRARTLPELTRRVFPPSGPLDRLSRREGRLSLVTASDFSRSHLVRSFLLAGDGAAAGDPTPGRLRPA